MGYSMDEAAIARVADYFARIGRLLGCRAHRESFATYAFGILGEGDRKSIEPIAARATAEPIATARVHDRLAHFIRETRWDDAAMRLEAARYAIVAMSAREAITTWIVDDTGMLKQGTHSPGVQRQYTGSAGKVANCQIAVSLSIATATEQLPVDFELYLPREWTDDAKRREAARIPESVAFRTKTEIACEMLGRAVDAGIPGDVVLADGAYGRSHEFRETIRIIGLDYAVAVDGDTRAWLLDARGRRRGDAMTVKKLGLELGEQAFRKFTWRVGPRGDKLASRFCFRRVKPAGKGEPDPVEREPVWLIIEWPAHETQPMKFYLTSLRRRMSKKQIVRTIKERWKTERVYEELKGELGFDHFEGRSFSGWHHHVSVVLCCYAFVVAERVRAFSPSARRTRRTDAVGIAA